jgi:hypothetical protein
LTRLSIALTGRALVYALTRPSRIRRTARGGRHELADIAERSQLVVDVDRRRRPMAEPAGGPLGVPRPTLIVADNQHVLASKRMGKRPAYGDHAVVEGETWSDLLRSFASTSPRRPLDNGD